jgi:hypothetical protein
MYIHRMECSSAIKMNEVLTHASIWMGLENSVLTEITQEKHCIIPLLQNM